MVGAYSSCSVYRLCNLDSVTNHTRRNFQEVYLLYPSCSDNLARAHRSIMPWQVIGVGVPLRSRWFRIISRGITRPNPSHPGTTHDVRDYLRKRPFGTPFHPYRGAHFMSHQHVGRRPKGSIGHCALNVAHLIVLSTFLPFVCIVIVIFIIRSRFICEHTTCRRAGVASQCRSLLPPPAQVHAWSFYYVSAPHPLFDLLRRIVLTALTLSAFPRDIFST